MFTFGPKKLVVSIIILAAAAVVLSSPGGAQVPYLINYQGRLTDISGNPVPGGEYQVTFRIWSDSLSSDVPSYQEWISPNQTILVINGLFNYQLGSNEELPPWIVANDTALWLGIQIGDDDELTPRARLTSVPYAYKAWKAEYSGYADSAGFSLSGGGGGGWVDDGSVVRLETSSDYVGIGTASPTNRLHIVGSESSPLLYVQKTGSGRGVKVSTTSACAIWVENAGNHGLRVTNANGDGIHITSAGGWAGYFNGDGYFSGEVGVGTLAPAEKIDVAGGSIRTDSRLISTVATGTAPLGVSSETMVANLNSDMIDGQHAINFANTSHTHSEKATCTDIYEGMTNASSQVTINFPVTFAAAPYFSVTGIIKSGSEAGSMAHIPTPTPGTSNVTLTIQYWNGAIFTSVGDNIEVQLSYVAAEK
ncbi:MAG: hypothetical protein JSV44_09440 [Candidatus Zixiibacteriota bacterium]|nr:MAG: hypothetical protein JSV44_09440 [candidate division Zixibacteria bacterium]